MVALGRLRTRVALVTVAAVLCVGATVPSAQADTAPSDPSLPATVSADPLPTAQINGVVWKQQVIGSTVFVGGDFSSARPPGSPAGTNESPRTYLMSYDLTTGALLPFAPVLNAQVKDLAASPDGTVLYVAGQFTTVNGANRYRVAAFSTATGALLTTFKPTINAPVSAIDAVGDAVFIGGSFTSVNGVAKSNLASLRASDAATLPFAATPAGGGIQALTVSPDGGTVVVGGGFTTMNGSGSPGYGLARLNASTGASLPMPVNTLVRNGGNNAAILDLESDATSFYGTGFTFGGGGNFEGTFAADWATANLTWMEDCHGDTYSAYPVGDAVYAASHKHFCGNIGGFPQTTPWQFHRGTALSKAAMGVITPEYNGYADHRGLPAPALLNWYPDINAGTFTGKSQGPWTVTGSGSYVLYGGEFTEVNGVPQQGLVRFAPSSSAPNAVGPESTAQGFPLVATPDGPGSVQLTWQTNWDRDNETLTYNLYRASESNPAIYTSTVTTPFWKPQAMSFRDSGQVPGSSQRYRIVASDPFGNVARSNWITVTVASDGTPSTYARTVLNDGPFAYWRLGEPSGTAVNDTTGFLPATAAAGVTRNVPGALLNDTNTASRFSGTSTGYFSTTDAVGNAPDVFSVEAWVKTSSNRGGRIVGWGNSANGTSSQADRTLYLDNSGRVFFGVQSSAIMTVNSGTGFNNNAWHHVVGTYGAGAMRLYVDGVQVAQRTDVVYLRNIWGYWRVGGDRLTNFPNRPTSDYLNGDLDEVAVYNRVLSAGSVSAHFVARSAVPPSNQSPVASFTATPSLMSVALNASASTDPDGTVVGYSWAFGDGTTGTGVTANHTYATAGTYTVTLTVTDNLGATGTTTRQVTATPPANQSPTASFTASSNGLGVSVDGAASSDPDGSVTGYAWNFGDGGTSTGNPASHTYATAGTYTITLTVTDNQGATASTTRDVTVVAPPDPGQAFVVDDFGRTVSNGWGPADFGGSWAAATTASRYSVAGQRGLHTLAAGQTATSTLDAVSTTTSDTTLTLSADKAPTGSYVWLSVQARRAAPTNFYGARVALQANGTVQLHVTRGNGTPVAGGTVAGLTFAAGDQLQVRVQVQGTSPTTVRAKIWPAAQPEPAAWNATMTDSTDGLQVPGSFALSTYVGGSVTNGPIVSAFDNLRVNPIP